MAVPQSEHRSELLVLLDEFRSLLCRDVVGGVVYRMASQRRLVAGIAASFFSAPESLRIDAIRFLAATAESDELQRQTRSVVEALLAAASSLPRGPLFPIALRADLLQLLAHPGRCGSYSIYELDRLRHLEHVLRWLFLRQSAISVRRLGVDESDTLLSFLETHEAVHPFTRGKAEVQSRLGGCACRAAFGLFFAGIPDTPLVVVYVAIGSEPDPPTTVNSVLSGIWGEGVGEPKTACFYSITNCVDGLQGLQLGSYLIFLAMEELRRAWPSLRSFVTLSPAPLFGSWLRQRLASSQMSSSDVANARLSAELEQFIAAALALPESDATGRKNACSPWLTQQLARLATVYILFERRRAPTTRPSITHVRSRHATKCVDPVANFHVSNGGLVDQVVCFADLSNRGLNMSFGCMVHYRYDADFLSGRAPSWRYSSQGTLLSYRVARLLLPIRIGAHDIFTGLDLDRILDAAFVTAPILARVCAAGETLACPSDKDTFGFHVVIDGNVDVFATPLSSNDAAPRFICRVAAGEALGAVPDNASTTIAFVARAVTECSVLVIPIETVNHIRRTHPDVAKDLRRRALPAPSTLSTSKALEVGLHPRL